MLGVRFAKLLATPVGRRLRGLQDQVLNFLGWPTPICRLLARLIGSKAAVPYAVQDYRGLFAGAPRRFRYTRLAP